MDNTGGASEYERISHENAILRDANAKLQAIIRGQKASIESLRAAHLHPGHEPVPRMMSGQIQGQIPQGTVPRDERMGVPYTHAFPGLQRRPPFHPGPYSAPAPPALSCPPFSPVPDHMCADYIGGATAHSPISSISEVDIVAQAPLPPPTAWDAPQIIPAHPAAAWDAPQAIPSQSTPPLLLPPNTHMPMCNAQRGPQGTRQAFCGGIPQEPFRCVHSEPAQASQAPRALGADSPLAHGPQDFFPEGAATPCRAVSWDAASESDLDLLGLLLQVEKGPDDAAPYSRPGPPSEGSARESHSTPGSASDPPAAGPAEAGQPKGELEGQIRALRDVLRVNSIRAGGDGASGEALCVLGLILGNVVEIVGRLMKFSDSAVLDHAQEVERSLAGEEMRKWARCLGLMNLSGSQKQAINDLRVEQVTGFRRLREESARLNEQVNDALRASGDHPTVLSSVLKSIRRQQERTFGQEHQTIMDGLRALMLSILDPVQASILAVEAHPDRVDVVKLATALAAISDGGNSGETNSPSCSSFLRDSGTWPRH